LEAALASSGLSWFRPPGRRRPIVAYGAPLPTGVAAERDLADIVLAAVETVWRIREVVIDSLPAGWRLVDLYDVWLGAPSLVGQVAAADYRIELVAVSEGGIAALSEGAIAAAADALLGAERLPRERAKGSSVVRYDLRPLLGGIRLVGAGQPVTIRVRTRFDPELGTGRPAEVVAALGEMAGMTLESRSVVRERLILAEDLEREARVAARPPTIDHSAR
jgi:hypothetical protein